MAEDRRRGPRRRLRTLHAGDLVDGALLEAAGIGPQSDATRLTRRSIT
jgi:hypothetical protein